MSYSTQHKSDRSLLWLKKLPHATVIDRELDESAEASMRQRIRHLEYNLFDEYWDELQTYRQHIRYT